MAATMTLNNTLQYVLPWVNFYPLTLGATQQPFIGMCERVAQIILSPPLNPNFNRNTINFITTTGVQTYVSAGSWIPANPYSVGQFIIDSNGNGQLVLQAGVSQTASPPVPPTWSTGLFTNTTDGTVVWQNLGVLGAIPQVSDFGWIERCELQDINNANTWKTLDISSNMSRDTQTSCPKTVSAIADDNQGDVTFRLSPPPAAAYPIVIQYQRLHTPFTSLSNLWGPIPDRLFYIYSTGVLALAYMYKGDDRAQATSQHFVTSLLSYFGGLTETQKNAFLSNWNASLAEANTMQKAQQAVAARGV
jgi:hypothetical protein